jgi:hypothetical protein
MAARRAGRGRRGAVRADGGPTGRWSSALLLAATAFGLVAPWMGCMGGPPSDADDICSIFSEKRSWHRSAVGAFERWGVPEAVQLAIIHQESSFRATARPPRRRFLGFLPGPRPSSAYGYGQVVDSTWDRYRRTTGRLGASRDDFDDVVDFIGWYADRIHRRTGVAKNDATELYAAYHEGPAGYRRGTHLAKPKVSRVAVRVGHRASRYQSQYDACREDLSRRRRFLGIF